MGIKRGKGDVPASHVLGGAGVAMGLEVTVPALCPGTHSILGRMPGRHLRFSQCFCWCLWWVEGAACAAGTVISQQCLACRSIPGVTLSAGHTDQHHTCHTQTAFYICPAAKILNA